MAERVTPSRSQNAGGAAQDNRLQQAVESIAELEVQLAAQLEQQLVLRREIEIVIAGVQDERLRLLLELRYIDAWIWDHIASFMGISNQRTFILHKKALGLIVVDTFSVI